MDEESNKIKDDLQKEYDKKLEEEKKKLITKLLDIYPHLAEDKDTLHEKLEAHSTPDQSLAKPKVESAPLVFSKFKLNDKTYYADDKKGVWDESITIIGTVLTYDKNGIPDKIVLFNDIDEDSDDTVAKIMEDVIINDLNN